MGNERKYNMTKDHWMNFRISGATKARIEAEAAAAGITSDELCRRRLEQPDLSGRIKVLEEIRNYVLAQLRKHGDMK